MSVAGRIDRTLQIGVKPGGFMESQSGIQRRNPKIFCRLLGSGRTDAEAFVLVHPTSNFHHHYLAEPLAQRGATVLLVNTRFVGNDSMLQMERGIQDLGAAIRFLRESGFSRITLIGNSGGGSLASFYQEQAERLTVRDTPDGRPMDLAAVAMPASRWGSSMSSPTSPAILAGPRVDCGWTCAPPAAASAADGSTTSPACPTSRSNQVRSSC